MLEDSRLKARAIQHPRFGTRSSETILDEHDLVAREPDRGFHFHIGRALSEILGYEAEPLRRSPEQVIESFAGTGICVARVQFRSDRRFSMRVAAPVWTAWSRLKWWVLRVSCLAST